jgi:Tetratricopeptide repeat
LQQIKELQISITPPQSEIDKEAFRFLLCPSPDIRKQIEEKTKKPVECPNEVFRHTIYRMGHQEILDKYPQSTYAKYVLYTNALNNLYPSGQAPIMNDYLINASEIFEKLVMQYPPFELTDKAMYYLSVSDYYLDKKDKANELLNQLIAKYPDSDGAEMAKEFMKDPSSGKSAGHY